MIRPLAAFAAAVLVVGCGGSDGDAGVVDGEGLEGTITVSAAASLADAFTLIADRFVGDHPSTRVELNLDSSSTLATQILEGAPADVYASADRADMARLQAAGRLAGVPVEFARNRMVVVTRAGNPEGVDGLDDLADLEVVSLCAESAPCGRYAARVLDSAAVAIPESQVTRSTDVGGALTAVAEGDAVAGIVYASDAVRAGDAVEVVEIPAEHDVVASYPIAALAGADAAAVAAAFVDAVRDPAGQAVLEELGFLPAA